MRWYRIRHFLTSLTIAAGLLAVSWCAISVITGSFMIALVGTSCAATGGVVGRVWGDLRG